MDLDKPLDDLITDSRKTRGGDSNSTRGRGGNAPRQSRERAAPIPYAVRPISPTPACVADEQRPPPRSTEDKWVHDAYQGSGRGGRGGGRGGREGGFGQRGEGGDGTRVAGTGVGFTGLSPRIEVVGLHYEVTPQDLKVGRAMIDHVDGRLME